MLRKEFIEKGIGTCWWDLDEQGRMGIECDNPPHDQHYLLTFKMPTHGDWGHLEKIATVIVHALNKEYRITRKKKNESKVRRKR